MNEVNFQNIHRESILGAAVKAQQTEKEYEKNWPVQMAKYR